MTIQEAQLNLERPLTFGDEAQIEATRVIGLRDELAALAADTGCNLLCADPDCACADVRHGILDRWDAEILEAQIARIHIMTDEDAPDWTAKQIEALERA
jgi:hypothetical protein